MIFKPGVIIIGWLLHPNKSKSMLITTRQKRQLTPLTLKLTLNNIVIEQVSHHKVLGVIIDENFTWQPHISTLIKKLSCNLYLLYQLKQYVNQDARKMFFHAHCLSLINYASTVWSNTYDVHIQKVNSLHRRGINLISDDKSVNTDDKFRDLCILPLKQQFHFNTALLTFKIINKLVPPYLTNFLTPSIRSHSQQYILPKPRIDIFKCSFAFSGPSIWNSLPSHVKTNTSIGSFKKALKTYYLT